PGRRRRRHAGPEPHHRPDAARDRLGGDDRRAAPRGAGQGDRRRRDRVGGGRDPNRLRRMVRAGPGPDGDRREPDPVGGGAGGRPAARRRVGRLARHRLPLHLALRRRRRHRRRRHRAPDHDVDGHPAAGGGPRVHDGERRRQLPEPRRVRYLQEFLPGDQVRGASLRFFMIGGAVYLAMALAMSAWHLARGGTRRFAAVAGPAEGTAAWTRVPRYAYLAPAVPLAAVALLRWPMIPAFLLGIVFALLVTRSEERRVGKE